MFWIMSHDVQLSPAASNAAMVTLPLTPSSAWLGALVTQRPAAVVVPPLPPTRRGTCQRSPATLLTAISLPCTSEVLVLTSRSPGSLPDAGQHRDHAGRATLLVRALDEILGTHTA